MRTARDFSARSVVTDCRAARAWSSDMVSRRLGRIASRIRFLVASVIQQELSDPRLGMITILRVEPTKDLKEARVFYSIFGDAGVKSRTRRAIEGARSFIQREVGKNLETRHTPHLRFILDESQERMSRLESLLERTSLEGQHGEEADQED